MQSKTIAEGITAIIEYCREIRTNDTIRGYAKACNTIRAYYEKSGQTYYNVGIPMWQDSCRLNPKRNDLI